MTDFIGGILASIFGTHAGLATLIISMFPLFELKGGIPVGMSTAYWGEYVLSGTEAFLFALLGSCLVVPIIALIFTPILKWLKRTKLFKKLGTFIDEKVRKHSNDIDKKTANNKFTSSTKKTIFKMSMLALFVAVPIPLTGVWTGTCVGVVIGLKFWQNVLSCVVGNAIAGLIIMTVCKVFPKFPEVLVLIVLAIIVVMIIVMIVKYIISSKKSNDSTKEKPVQSASANAGSNTVSQVSSNDASAENENNSPSQVDDKIK